MILNFIFIMKTKNDYIDNSFTMMLQCQSCRSFVRFLRIDWSFPLPPFRHCFVIFFFINLPPFPLCFVIIFFFINLFFFSIYFFFLHFLWGIQYFFYSSLTIFFLKFFFLIPILYSKILVIEPLQ